MPAVDQHRPPTRAKAGTSRHPLRRLLLGLLALVLLLAAVLVIRTARFTSRQLPSEPATAPQALPGAPERLAAALRIPTVSPADPAQRRPEAFAAFHAHLLQSFPRVHAALRREAVGRDALLYTWPGADPALPPIVLMGHMDVVPVEPGTERAWTHPPFSGRIAGGFIWGRGSMDNKNNVLGLLEAAEALLAGGFRPRRTVLFAFGADEEASGREGAARIAALLKARNVRPELVLDEGGLISQGVVPGLSGLVALVGIAEKGYLSVELSARSPGGHSSMPPPRTTVGRIGRAVAALEENPLPARTGGVMAQFLAHVGPEMPFGMRLVFANRWLFDPLIKRQLSASTSANATIRTTTAPTMLEGSPKENVLAAQARAVVNFRLLPGDSAAGVLGHVRRTVDDPEVQVRAIGKADEPSPVSRTDSPAWHALQRTIRQVYPEATVAPYLVVAATDARYFHSLSPNVYRFMPNLARSEDLARMHGTNERISVEGYRQAVRFYAQLIENTAR